MTRENERREWEKRNFLDSGQRKDVKKYRRNLQDNSESGQEGMKSELYSKLMRAFHNMLDFFRVISAVES